MASRASGTDFTAGFDLCAVLETRPMLDLTIAIPVKNENHNLSGCLEAVGSDFAREIVVIDSGSSDGTQKIAKKNGAKVIQFDWNGAFPKKRNWFLQNHPPATKWVLFLDADEHVTPEFKQALHETLPQTTYAGFWLRYSIYFLNRELKGGYPLKKLALFRVGAGEYERIDEERWSHLDMEIHEHPILDGPVGSIRPKIDHRDFRGLDSWARKHNEYASWEAKRYLQKRPENQPVKWTLKQKIKYRLLGSPLSGPVFFFGCFFLMGGFRDGKRGLAWALLKCGYFTQVYARIEEEKSARARDDTPSG